MRYRKEFGPEVYDIFPYLIADKITMYWIHHTLKNHQEKFFNVDLDIIIKYGDNELIDSDKLKIFLHNYNYLRMTSGSCWTCI